MMTKRVLTGVTTTGIPHLGNYVGAIRPAIRAAQEDGVESYLFLANYHGIIKCHDPAMIHESTQAVAATWLACGLDTERTTFYRQSDIPEILELNWILTCITAKGLMNRAHAYKAAVQANLENGQEDQDFQVEMGLYSYPILMTADILMFKAHSIPVGRDQIQHVEMARDIAQRFNSRFGKELFVLPEAAIDENVELLVGLDGRKMSKSYGNTIPLFQTPKQRQKSVNKILTNLKEPGEPKFKEESPLFEIYQAFATEQETADFERALNDGLAWGEAKKILSEKIGAELDGFTEKYHDLIAHPEKIEEILQAGAAKARVEARELLAQVKDAVGIRTLG
ncbi:tryptophan--tRNA ligase [Wielerella bovis]|uniref:tryptophan--tRNA ligase n=1 Tax=Wielerella bovis TaxID=2917790 RepID=UPI0020184842|nr:tryptophan--tRNA ligase [Wielerella bovis]ULJ65840.1 tryptophan--tRNA ligase [Wielerella bovis]ULJ68231.1 tryptophan--tRNA ligase [Wielerella bovis]ULJ70364.1 tryptophan--tRNA ligase [Wielerella bovis]